MATTWISTGDFSTKAVCTTGTEAAPTTAASGLNLSSGSGVGSVVVFVEATDGVTNLTSGSIDFYFYNSTSTNWCKMLGIDGSIPGGAIRFVLPGISVNPMSRLAAIPNGLGTAVTIYMNGLAVGVAGV